MNRPRSDALTGPSDARFRSPAEIELYNAVKTPIAVAPALEQFLKKVFASKDLMERLQEPGDIVGGVYDLYSESGGGGARMNSKSVIQAARGNWGQFLKILPSEIFNRGFFQYTMVSDHNAKGKVVDTNLLLKDPRIFVNDALALEAAGDFLYFCLNGGRAACRVYLNVSFDSMPAVLKTALALPGGLAASVVDVKTTGPGSARADSVVMYCKSTDAAKAVAQHMLDAIQKGVLTSTDQTIPAMTTRIGPAVAIGAEPKPQETGLGRPLPPEYPRDAQSFGSVRSQVIGAAILNFRANAGVLGAGFDVFKQLAAIGFKGYGLDPASPGD